MTEEQKKTGLKECVLSLPEVVAQSISGIAPTAAPAIAVSLAFAHAGERTWIAFAVATLMMLLVAYNINQFTRRSSSSGSLYTYTSLGLGRPYGIVVGLSLSAAYLSIASATLCETTMFLNSICGSLLHFQIEPLIGVCVLCLLMTFIAVANVELSTRTMLWLEAFSILLILCLFAAVMQDTRAPVLDMAQFRSTAVADEGFHLALIIAIFSFVGFESAASLGAEARDPTRNIPLAVVGSTIISGIFFVTASYVMVLGCRLLHVDLGHAQTALLTMADRIDLPLVGEMTSLGAGVSIFAAGLACLNASARMIYSMSRDGMLHDLLGKCHPVNQTPHNAVIASAILALSTAVVFTVMRFPTLDVVGWLASFGTYGFIASYFLVSIAAPFFLKKSSQLERRHLVFSVLGVIAVLYALIGSIFPVPPPPYNYLPYLFALYLTCSAWWCIRRDRQVRALSLDIETMTESDTSPRAD